MKQYEYTNKKGTWTLWQAIVRLGDGTEAVIQYFLPKGKEPRLAKPAEAVKEGYEIHEIGKAKTPVISKIRTKEEA